MHPSSKISEIHTHFSDDWWVLAWFHTKVTFYYINTSTLYETFATEKKKIRKILSDETRNQRCYILSRKKAMNAYLNGELLNEIRGRGLQDTITLSSSSTREDLLRFIDSVRRKELYHHKVCSHTCKEKGNIYCLLLSLV